MVDVNRRKRLIEYFVNTCKMSLTEASSVADLNCVFYDVLNERKVRFMFRKRDGSIRHAYGTMKRGLIPEFGKSSRTLPFGLQMFFDLECLEFRSFKKENLLDFEI